jgi:hypothetical protein
MPTSGGDGKGLPHPATYKLSAVDISSKDLHEVSAFQAAPDSAFSPCSRDPCIADAGTELSLTSDGRESEGAFRTLIGVNDRQAVPALVCTGLRRY